MRRLTIAIAFVLSQLCCALTPAASMAAQDAGQVAPLGPGAGGRPVLFLGNRALPPMNFLEDGQPAGVVVDLARDLAKRLPYPAEIRLTDWEEAQTQVLDGRADALLQINPSPERREVLDFSEPLLESEFTIFTTARHPSVAGKDDLHGLTVGVERKGLPILLLRDDSRIETRVVPSLAEGFELLKSGAIDAVVADRWVGCYVLAQGDARGVRMVEEPLAKSPSAIAVKKGNAALLGDVNRALAAMRADGTYARIVGLWQPKQVVFRTREQLAHQRWLWLTATVSIALLVALAGILAQGREIRRRRRSEATLRGYVSVMESLERLGLAMRQAPDMEALMRAALDVVLEVMRSDRAWLLYPCDPGAPSWSVPMMRARQEYVESVTPDQEIPMSPEAAAVIEACLGSENAVHFGPEGDRPLAPAIREAYGVESQLCLALYPKVDRPWLLGLHQCSHARKWTEVEKHLFKAMGGSIQEALNSLLSWRDLRESEERFRALVEQAQDAIFLHGRDARFLLVNQRACDALGYDRDELLAMKVTDIDPDFTPRNDPVAIWTDLPRTFESRHRRKDGSLMPVEVRLSRIVYGSQDVVLASVSDITERKRSDEELRRHRDHLEELVARRTRDLELEVAERKLAQEELGRAKEAAEAANLAKSVFLANMSHELRTPLNAVLGFAQVMRFEPGLNPGQRDGLDAILRGGEHLLGLINDILDISKIEAGQTKAVASPFDLWGLLDDAAEMMRSRAAEKDLRLAVERDPSLPRSVIADERKLRQVLINLLGNAVKFTAQGSVVLRARPLGLDRLAFEVEDTGPGLSDAAKANLFERFGQGLDARDGAGLGLYISKKLVETMGGSIAADSTPGKGARFSFEIPFAPAGLFEPAGPRLRATSARLAPGVPALRVLVAEDQPENRRLLSRMLADAGFGVVEAADGEEAVRRFASERPDMVMMDLRMPVMDGSEAIRRIKSLPGGAATPVVAVTASAFEEDRQKVLAGGADDFLAKPIRLEALFDCIRRCLGAVIVPVDEPGDPPPAMGKDEARSLVALLPAELAARLEDALAVLDLRAFKALLEDVAGTDRRLADVLRRLADGYEVNALIDILSRKRSS